MKNKLNRLISVAVMIALLLTSCVIPMSAMADGIEEDYSVDAYRYVLRTTTMHSITSNGARRYLGTWVNRTGSTTTYNKNCKLSNDWSLSIGAHANRNHCPGLPGNYGSASSTYKYSVTVRPRYGVRLYATARNYNGMWEHKRQRQVRKAYTTEWVDTSDPAEVSYSYASGTWYTFGYESFRAN